MLNFTGSFALGTSLIRFPKFLISSNSFLVCLGEETSCGHFVTSSELVKYHVHFPTCVSHTSPHILILTLAQGQKVHQGDSETSVVKYLRVECC